MDNQNDEHDKRSRAEDALRVSEERLRLFVAASSDIVYRMSADWSQMHAMGGKGLLADTTNARLTWLEEYIPGSDKPLVQAAIVQAIRTKTTFALEHRVFRADGTTGWVFSRAVPLLSEHGEIVEWFGAASDITERKRAQDALTESEAHLRLATEVGRIATWEWHLLTGDVFWNEQHFLLFGMQPRPNPLKADAFFQHVHPDERARVGERLKKAIAEKSTFEADFKAVMESGETRWMSGYGRVTEETTTGEPTKMSGLMFDITERKRAQEAAQAALETVAQANETLEARVQKRTLALSERSHELSVMSELRQELVGQLVTAQEEERARIARDLHDDTGQQVTGLLLGLASLKTNATIAADADALSKVSDLQHLANDIAQKSHRIALNLRPTALDDIGLVQALKNYAEQWMQWSGLTLEVDGMGMKTEGGEKRRLTPEVETTIYRIVQEALTNVLRHATGNKPAQRVNVLVQRRDSDVLTVIEDDGPGFDVEAALSGPPGERRLGLFGMQERARLAGGTLDIESTPGEGTTVYLRIPLP